ncbi:unnamed protein product [Pleuronectes platessa]|uniref:Uncharacterized protein n=1 Tax=Pleuronectes platessa TaxID=8262 RepID=A0A9N7V620_PLEPL|nr:unnamed protein product [Pleuronectes platessa]
MEKCGNFLSVVETERRSAGAHPSRQWASEGSHHGHIASVSQDENIQRQNNHSRLQRRAGASGRLYAWLLQPLTSGCTGLRRPGGWLTGLKERKREIEEEEERGEEERKRRQMRKKGRGERKIETEEEEEKEEAERRGGEERKREEEAERGGGRR